jgi:hypothetical protein
VLARYLKTRPARYSSLRPAAPDDSVPLGLWAHAHARSRPFEWLYQYLPMFANGALSAGMGLPQLAQIPHLLGAMTGGRSHAAFPHLADRAVESGLVTQHHDAIADLVKRHAHIRRMDPEDMALSPWRPEHGNYHTAEAAVRDHLAEFPGGFDNYFHRLLGLLPAGARRGTPVGDAIHGAHSTGASLPGMLELHHALTQHLAPMGSRSPLYDVYHHLGHALDAHRQVRDTIGGAYGEHAGETPEDHYGL